MLPEFRMAEDASAAQRKTADNAPTLALPGSRPPPGDYLAPGVFRTLAQEFTIVTLFCLLCHPLAQEFTMVLRAGDSLPAVRKALGAVEGGGPGRSWRAIARHRTGTKARNGAQPLAERTNYKYHPTKVTKKIQKKKHISN